ncbi:MAG: UDP-N-acetylglucosamine 1-carboxyvinyltransferase [Campylobacterales bacterium]
MDYLYIIGENRLSGTVKIAGAKNAALPLIAASILSKTPYELDNLPNVADVKTFLKLLSILGAANEWKSDHSVSIDTSTIVSTTATYDIVRTMRASILTLGPLLARYRQCDISLPGGCAIGQRPVDLHIKAMEMMGAEIEIKGGYIHAKAPEGLKGASIVFDKITVTGTENVVMAAALAKGVTKIVNAAKEPEVVQLCEVIRDAGIKVEGIGTDELIIHGSDGELLELQPTRVIPDRIEAGTFLCAGAITNSEISLEGANPNHLEAVLIKLQQMGFGYTASDERVTIHPAKKIYPIDIITTEYPGFPTDMQAQFMALATQAEGISSIDERLFENRFMHAAELQRLGAHIVLKGNVATIVGPTPLYGADVMSSDLRASSALVIAGLAAKGTTKVHRIYHLDRGYEKIEEKLTALGAKIFRAKE